MTKIRSIVLVIDDFIINCSLVMSVRAMSESRHDIGFAAA